jgi:Mor family transcriptional regulator
MKMGRRGWTYPSLWVITRDKALRARQEYRAGAKLRDLMLRYRVGYGTIQSVISGQHASVRGLPDLARGRGPKR